MKISSFKPHTCKIDKNVTTWVVHGLWPAENNSIGPNFCNASLPFNPNAIQPILGLLLKYWPNLYTDTQIESFWEHEWTKHGTCALSINSQIKNQDDYFSVSLGLRDKFDFGPILAEANIIPSDTLLYSLDNILNAIQAKLGVRPLTTCFIQKDSNIQIFSQMQICFDKDFSLIDCRDQVLELAKIAVDNTPQETGCSHTRPISYPIIKH